MKSALTLGFGLALALFAPRTASADPITFTLQGVNESYLTASVELTYTAIDSDHATLTIDIANTSGGTGDPRITSFAFSTPLGVLEVSGSAPTGWTYTFNPDAINTPGQYGFFDVAALTGPNFNGGSPNSGIARGDEVTFAFSLTGNGLDTLTEETFLQMSSNEPGNGDAFQYFIARFQRTPGGTGSDVAIPTGPPTSRVPEPTTLMLTALGAVGLFARRRAIAA